MTSIVGQYIKTDEEGYTYKHKVFLKDCIEGDTFKNPDETKTLNGFNQDEIYVPTGIKKIILKNTEFLILNIKKHNDIEELHIEYCNSVRIEDMKYLRKLKKFKLINCVDEDNEYDVGYRSNLVHTLLMKVMHRKLKHFEISGLNGLTKVPLYDIYNIWKKTV